MSANSRMIAVVSRGSFFLSVSRRVFLKGAVRLQGIAAVSAIVLVLIPFLASPALPQVHSRTSLQTRVIKGAEVSEASIPKPFDRDLRNLPRASKWQLGNPVTEVPRLIYPRTPGRGEKEPPITGYSPRTDPLTDYSKDFTASESSRAFASPDLNFAGQGFTGVAPPDTVGDVGRDYYIQMVNHSSGSSFTIYNKNDGSIAAGPLVLSSMGTGVCSFGRGDPIVLFDHLADRWLLSEFSSFGNRLCVYLSQTNDPISGGWYAYQFQTPEFPDYPKYAVWPDGYYISTNESSPAVYAIDRNQMLNGLPATMQRFTASSLGGFLFQALLPSDVDGATPPPAGSPNYFIRHRDDEVHNPGSNDPNQDFLEIWELRVDFSTPANSTLTGPFNIPMSEFDSDLCGLVSFECFPQPGTNVELDPLREVVMWRLQYRNFSTHETLVGNFVTDADNTDHGGIRWFELRKNGAGPWTLFQEGTYAPDQNNRWMGSIAMDGQGNIAVGYSVTSENTFPGIRYVGRLAGDPLGAMPQGEHTIIGGLGSSSINRWGDYSSMNLDPVDDCTFWYTNEYALANGTWATQIAVFSFDSCIQGDLPDLVVESIVTDPESPDPGQTTVVEVTVRNQGSQDAGSFTIDWYSDLATPPSPSEVGDLSERVTSLAAGNTHTMTGTFTYLDSGFFDMFAQVDTEQEVDEEVEDNNILGPVEISVGLCECDLNRDEKCDMQDWLIFGQDWGRTDCNDPRVEPCECDLNSDGICDMQDWLLFGQDWGRTDCIPHP